MFISTLVQLVAFSTATPNPSTNDSWITTKARIAVITTAKVDSNDVNIDTTNGVVTLYGKVENAAEKSACERSVAGINGVVRVENMLQIVTAAKAKVTEVSDDGIKNNIEAAFTASPALKGDSPKVLSVDKGVVMLGGKVKDTAAHVQAVAITAKIAGVKRIATKVDVENDTDLSGSAISDSSITTKVKLALISNENVPAMNVHVDTSAGYVVLFGKVDSDLAKKEAELEASKIAGVMKVRNDITVDTKHAKADKVQDKDIAANVKTVLSKEHVEALWVDVKGGVIKIGGQVKSEEEKARLAFLSRATKGARAVKNELTVSK